MKTYFCIACVLSVFVLVQCAIPPEIKCHLDECLKEYGLQKDILTNGNFEDSNSKCFASCVLKKGNRLIDGKLSIDKELDMARKYYPTKFNDALKEKLTACVNKANEGKDDCTVAGSMFKCMSPKHEVPKP